MPVHGGERADAGREGLIGDRREHENTGEHCQRCDPEQGVAEERPREERRGRRPAAEGHGALQVARTNHGGVGPEPPREWRVGGFGQALSLGLELGGVGRVGDAESGPGLVECFPGKQGRFLWIEILHWKR